MSTTIIIENDGSVRIDRTWSGHPPVDAPQTIEEAVRRAKHITDEQRRALFAAWHNVFPYAGSRLHRVKHARHIFTRLVLQLDPNESASWSTLGGGQASRLLDVLDACERVQSILHGS